MIAESQLLAAVDAAFAETGRGLMQWPDPHPDRSPPEEAYSRLLDPGKWRIVGARAEAWVVVLCDAGLAVVERDATFRWRPAPSTTIARADRMVPLADGAVTLAVGRSRLGELDDAGVTLGVGDPAVCIGWFPQCGCDACDSGSQDELDELDRHFLGIVSGRFRRLSNRDREITVVDGNGWSASGRFKRREVDAVLADPTGWEELSGSSWLHSA